MKLDLAIAQNKALGMKYNMESYGGGQGGLDKSKSGPIESTRAI